MQISRILEVSKPTGLYEKGNSSIWEDDYISRQLLEVHLNQETDSASRKKPVIRKTVHWIESHLKGKPKEILDLGCGPGLYCELLAEHGHHVTGVDFSRHSITYAQQEAKVKNLKICYLHKNYLDITFEDRFDLIIMIFCDFDVLIPEERIRLLQKVYRALRPGGLFIFDTLNPKAPEKISIPGRTWEAEDGGFWMNEPYLVLSESILYEEEGVILQQHIVCSKSDIPMVYRFWTHYYKMKDLSDILKEQGFFRVESHENLLPDDGTGMNPIVPEYITSC